jgi:hypothetical protein
MKFKFVCLTHHDENKCVCVQDKSGSIEFLEFCLVIHAIKDRGRYVGSFADAIAVAAAE